MNWPLNARSTDGAMNGLELARCTTAGGFGRVLFLFFFQAEDGIRDYKVTGVQTCALPISFSQAPLPQHVLLRLRERREKSGHRRIELRVELLEGRDEGSVVGIEHVVEHRRRDTWRLGPIPVRQSELRIATELANGGLQPSDVGTVPGEKPPVLVRAVED